MCLAQMVAVKSFLKLPLNESFRRRGCCLCANTNISSYLPISKHFNTFACGGTMKQMVCIMMGYIRLYVLS